MLEETDTTFDADGNSILVTTRERFHDDASSSEGALGTPTSGIYARVSYMAAYFDAANRETDSVNVGTNGGSSYTRPSTVPSSSDTVLVTDTAYDGAGDANIITDPRGIKTQYNFDLLGKKLAEIDNSDCASPPHGTAETDYTYDGDGHELTMTAIVSGGTNQTTAYVFGVGGTAGTNLFSNDLIAKTEFPDPSTGAASTSAANDVSNTYDLQGDIVTMKDQNGTTHTYAFDLLGRQTSDSISVATGNPEGIDTSIVKHATSYTDLGLVYKLTSYNSSSVVVNQVQYAYDGFGQEISEYQEHSGAVNVSTTANVQYSYTEGIGNSNRMLSMTYPNGRVLDYDYSPTQMPITGITSSGTTATATTVLAHGLSVGNKIMIQGAGSHYDGLVTIASVPTSTTFTYTIASYTGSTSATGISEAKLSIDEAISRLDGEQDTAGTSAGIVLEGYSFLGLDTIVIRNRPENNTALTYVQQTGDTLYSSDGGDQYTGLDRFGRVIDQFWVNTSTGSAVDRLQYGYDRDGNVLYEKNDVNGSFSELFHTNATTSGDDATAYDPLNRLVGFQVGTLSASAYNGGTLDTVSTLNTSLSDYSQSWNLDAVGNWDSLSTNGGTAVANSFNSRNMQTGQGSNTLSYDYDGNTLIDQSGEHYVYDAWNQLVTLKASNNTTVLLSLTHDATNRVVIYNNGSGDTGWFYDDLGRMIENNYSDIYAQYVRGLDYTNDLILRDRNTDGPTTGTSTGNYGKSGSGLDERLYAEHDANWDITTVVDTSASVKEHLVYTPYGQPTTMDGSWSSYDDSTTYAWAYKFQGARFEPTGNFSFMGARLLDTQTGRWLTEDPTGYVDGANLYGAFRDSPGESIDPKGLQVGATINGISTTVTKPQINNDNQIQYGFQYYLPARYAGFTVYQTVGLSFQYEFGNWLQNWAWMVGEGDESAADVMSIHQPQGLGRASFTDEINFPIITRFDGELPPGAMTGVDQIIVNLDFDLYVYPAGSVNVVGTDGVRTPYNGQLFSEGMYKNVLDWYWFVGEGGKVSKSRQPISLGPILQPGKKEVSSVTPQGEAAIHLHHHDTVDERAMLPGQPNTKWIISWGTMFDPGYTAWDTGKTITTDKPV